MDLYKINYPLGCFVIECLKTACCIFYAPNPDDVNEKGKSLTQALPHRLLMDYNFGTFYAAGSDNYFEAFFKVRVKLIHRLNVYRMVDVRKQNVSPFGNF